MHTTFEDILARDGILVYKTRGVSMKPMLRQNRDLVAIRVPSSRLKRFDVALYRRGKSYVLHRVVKVEDGYYLIRGDNTYQIETVPEEAVIGVLTGFQRNGKQISTDNGFYQIYVYIWNAIYPLRWLYVCLRRFAARVARKLHIVRKRR